MTTAEIWTTGFLLVLLVGCFAFMQTAPYRAWCRTRDIETLWVDCVMVTKDVESARRLFFAYVYNDKSWHKDLSEEEIRKLVWGLGKRYE